MKYSYLLVVFVFFVFLSSCEKDNLIVELSHVSSDRYYDKDILDTIPIYGKWEVIRTSGGFSGGGYVQDFDFLLFKKNGIFGILRNDSLLTVGKVEVRPSTSRFPLLRLTPDDEELRLTILFSEQFVSFDTDTLNLRAPCCDNFNTHLKKVP